MVVHYPPNLSHALGVSARGEIRGLLQRPAGCPPPTSANSAVLPAMTPVAHPCPTPSRLQAVTTETKTPSTTFMPINSVGSPAEYPSTGVVETDPGPPPSSARLMEASPVLGNRSRTILGIMRAGKRRRMANMSNLLVTTGNPDVTLPRLANHKTHAEALANLPLSSRCLLPPGPPPATPANTKVNNRLQQLETRPRASQQSPRQAERRRSNSVLRQYGSLYRSLIANVPPMDMREYERLLKYHPEGPARLHKEVSIQIDSVREVSGVEKTLSWLMETNFEHDRPSLPMVNGSGTRKSRRIQRVAITARK